jgi:hypothetical protein
MLERQHFDGYIISVLALHEGRCLFWIIDTNTFPVASRNFNTIYYYIYYMLLLRNRLRAVLSPSLGNICAITVTIRLWHLDC